MGKTPPLLRQWTLFLALSARRYGMTVREMARETDVTIRTVYRDLQTLQQAGFAVACQWHGPAAAESLGVGVRDLAGLFQIPEPPMT